MLGADNALGDRLVQPAGMPDRHHPLAHLHLVGIPKGDKGQRLLGVNLNHRQIGLGIRAHEPRGMPGAVYQYHLDFGGAAGHVMVGEDMALRIHEEPGPEPRELARDLLGQTRGVEETAQRGIVLQGQEGVGDLLPFGHLDMHDGRDSVLRYLRHCRGQVYCSACARRQLDVYPGQGRAQANHPDHRHSQAYNHKPT